MNRPMPLLSPRGHEQLAYEDQARHTHTCSHNYECWPWTLNPSIPRRLRHTSRQSLVFWPEKAIKFWVPQKPIKCCSSTVPFYSDQCWSSSCETYCTVTEICCMLHAPIRLQSVFSQCSNICFWKSEPGIRGSILPPKRGVLNVNT